MSNLPHLAAPLGVLESSPDCSSSVPGGSASSSVSDQLPLLKPVGNESRDLLPCQVMQATLWHTRRSPPCSTVKQMCR